MTWDAALQKVRLVDLKIWQPEPDSPIDFGETFIKTLLELKERFTIRSVTYDPYQLAFAAQTLTAAGINMVELPQSEKNLTDATTSLFTLVKGRNLAVYPDEHLRRQVAQAVAKETGRGWRITKEKRAHKIDAVVALAFACLGAEKERARHGRRRRLRREREPGSLARPFYLGRRPHGRAAGVRHGRCGVPPR